MEKGGGGAWGNDSVGKVRGKLSMTECACSTSTEEAETGSSPGLAVCLTGLRVTCAAHHSPKLLHEDSVEPTQVLRQAVL